MARKISKKTAAMCIVVVMAGLIFALKAGLSSLAKPMDSVAQRAEGSPGAKVRIVEFIDFQCPACATGFLKLKEYFARHPDDMYVQVKYFPLANIHRHALASALYGECAARQGKFWQFLGLLLPAQKQWSDLISADPIFQDMARQAGMDMAKLNSCLASEEARQAVENDRSLGNSLRVQSTPTYFINNKMVVGAKSLQEELDAYFSKQ